MLSSDVSGARSISLSRSFFDIGGMDEVIVHSEIEERNGRIFTNSRKMHPLIPYHVLRFTVNHQI